MIRENEHKHQKKKKKKSWSTIIKSIKIAELLYLSGQRHLSAQRQSNSSYTMSSSKLQQSTKSFCVLVSFYIGNIDKITVLSPHNDLAK